MKEKSAKQIKTLVFQPGVLTSDVAKGYLERLKKVLFIYPHTESSETLEVYTYYDALKTASSLMGFGHYHFKEHFYLNAKTNKTNNFWRPIIQYGTVYCQ